MRSAFQGSMGAGSSEDDAQDPAPVATAAAQSSGPVDPPEQKHAERLGVEAKELDAKAGKAAATPAGERRVTDAIAKDYKVDPSVVTDLRNRKIGYGEITIALALSQELMKQNKTMSQSQALDTILAKRTAGEGWGQIAHDLHLKLGHVRSKVEKAEKQVARVERSEKQRNRKRWRRSRRWRSPRSQPRLSAPGADLQADYPCTERSFDALLLHGDQRGSVVGVCFISGGGGRAALVAV